MAISKNIEQIKVRLMRAFRFMAIFALVILFVLPVGLASYEYPKKYPTDYYEQENHARGDLPIFDRVIDVPPSSETRVRINETGVVTVEGGGNNFEFSSGKLGQAAALVPSWLREAFVDNMLKAGSAPIRGIWVIPTFGDIDGDGDDDMVVGIDGTLYTYENIGGVGNPVYKKTFWYTNEYFGTDPKLDDEYCSPSFADLDNDTYQDLVVGTSDDIRLISNPRSDNWWGDVNLPGAQIDYPSPMVFDRNFENGSCNITLIWGTKNGQFYQEKIKLTDTSVSFSGAVMIRWLPKLSSYTAPRPWSYDFGGPEIDDDLIAIGTGEGSISLYKISGFTANDCEEIGGYFFSNIQYGRVTPVCCDLDGDRGSDLILGTQGAGVREFVNYGDPQYPDWRTDYEDPIAQAAGYVSAFDKQIMVYDESAISDYLDSIIRPIDHRYVDEIAFTCAYTPATQIRNNSLAVLFQENAKLIYERDSDLGYVVLEEKGDYTTATYNVRSGGGTMKITLPRDIYYWGIVHPRVTEEPVGYVDPNNGEITDPSSGGRFWREYLWTTADSEYPPGPEYPANWTGPKAYYPRDVGPPLLGHDATEASFLWDLQPYDYPAGFDHAGKIDSYPDDHKDHAIEKVSQWVEKTLILNQQESPEDERPNQPVRIAHGHNGNCGELQDLTIAAARTALIPARGVLLTGEDHVWSEFYAGGWHQWDNYWSDAGGVIADQLNYWWGWGQRGGSGVMSTMGDGNVADETGRYLPPDVTGKLQVHVTDDRGRPVDGARVMVFSHWVMQQTSVSVGPYQGPPPVTAPLPSIWGYTDQDGNVEFRVCHQDINIQVISDLGIYTGPKFMIGDTEIRKVDVQLNGYMPDPYLNDDGYNYYDSMYFAALSIDSATQEQGSFVSSDLCGQRISKAHIYSYTASNWGFYCFEKKVESGETQTQELIYLWEDGSILTLRNNGSIKTTVHVRVTIYKWSASLDDYEKPFLVPFNANGMGGGGFETNAPSTICGLLGDFYYEYTTNDTYWSFNTSISMMEDVRLVSDEGTFPVYWDDIHDAEHSLHAVWRSTVMVLKPGTERFLFQAEVNTKFGVKHLNISFDVLFKDSTQPVWIGYTGSGERAWGSSFPCGAAYRDWTEGLSSNAWLDDDPVWDVLNLNGSAKGILDTSGFERGHHRIRITAWDDSFNIATLSFNTNFTATHPSLTIDSPRPGDRFIDGTIQFAGSSGDDINLTSLTLEVRNRVYDLTDMILHDSTFLSTVEIGPDPGNYTLFFDAADNVGLVSHAWIDIVLLPPPDVTKPFVEITDPLELERIYRGDPITVRGIAEDDTEVVSLKAILPGGVKDLIGSYEGYSWQFKADTSSWPKGNCLITVEASDPSGNKFSAVRTVMILSNDIPMVDRDPPLIRIDKPSPGSSVDITGDLEIEGYVTDDPGPVSLRASVDGGATYIDIAVESSGKFVCSIPASDVLSGSSRSPEIVKGLMSDYTVRLRAQDGSGNEGTLTASYSITDRNAPEFIYMKAGARSGSSRIIAELLVNDSSTIERATWRLEDGNGGQLDLGILSFDDLRQETEGFAASWEIPIHGAGNYKLVVTAYDPFGNKAEESSSVYVVREQEGGGGPSILLLVAIIGTVFAALAIAIFIGVRFNSKE
jgi:hypothetical protein